MHWASSIQTSRLMLIRRCNSPLTASQPKFQFKNFILKDDWTDTCDIWNRTFVDPPQLLAKLRALCPDVRSWGIVPLLTVHRSQHLPSDGAKWILSNQ